MRFFVSLAAATYTLSTIGPVGWFLMFMVLAFGVAAFLIYWPLLLVVATVFITYRAARWVERREARRSAVANAIRFRHGAEL